MTRTRIEVEAVIDGHRRGTILYVEDVRSDLAEQVRPIATQLVADLVTATNLGPDDARCLAISTLAFRITDAQGYQREALRRGLLPL